MPINCHIAAHRVAVRADWSPMRSTSEIRWEIEKTRQRPRERPVKTRKREADVFLAYYENWNSETEIRGLARTWMILPRARFEQSLRVSVVLHHRERHSLQ